MKKIKNILVFVVVAWALLLLPSNVYAAEMPEEFK